MIKKLFCIAAFFLHMNACMATLLWSDQPIAYKQYYEVRTYMMEGINEMIPSMSSPIGYYVTYILDHRNGDNPGLIVYCVYSRIETSALLAHHHAILYLQHTEAHLQIGIPDDEYIHVPTDVPDAPRSGVGPSELESEMKIHNHSFRFPLLTKKRKFDLSDNDKSDHSSIDHEGSLK